MKYYVIFLCFLITAALSAQPVVNYNKASIEGGVGVHVPFGPMGAGDASDYTGFERFDLGYRHMFHKNWGLKLQYSYDAFRGDEIDSGIFYNRLSLSGVYNVGRLILPLRRSFGVLAHLGFGYASAKPVRQRSPENTGTLEMGITPQIRITERVTIYLDVTYVTTFKQHYDFTGKLMSVNYNSDSGSFATVSIGVMISLGNKSFHADWY